MCSNAVTGAAPAGAKADNRLRSSCSEGVGPGMNHKPSSRPIRKCSFRWTMKSKTLPYTGAQSCAHDSGARRACNHPLP